VSLFCSTQIRVHFANNLTDDEIDTLRYTAPGVLRAWGGAKNVIDAPLHAAPALAVAIQSKGLQIIGLTGARTPPENWTREQVQAALTEGGELRAEYLAFALSYQWEALEFSAPRSGVLLHHPTGSGKTFTGICWALLAPGPAIFVTRAASRNQYGRQIERFTRILPFVCKPSNEIRKKDRWKSLPEYYEWCLDNTQRPIIVIGWEALSDWADKLTIPVTSVIYDESHKGKSSKRWDAVPLPPKENPAYSQVVADIKRRGGTIKPSKENDGTEVGIVPLDNIAYCASAISKRAKRRLATTATPIPDRVRDLWGQLDLIEPFCWGSYRHFAFRYCDARPGLYGGLDDKGMSNQAELSTRLSHVVHSIPGAVTRASLPAKRRETWYIPESEQIKPTGGWQTAIKNAQRLGASAMLEIRLAMAASSKRPAVVARVAEHMESGHKVVIFTARQRDCDELRDALLKLTGKSAPAKVWSGHGGNDQDERYAMLQAYISHPGPCVLVGTGAAWGTAIDGLQCTDAAIFALLPYTPGDLNQWEGRFTRLGQDRPVTIYYPIAEGTADEHLASILLDKLPAVDSLAPDDSLDGAAEALAGEVTDSETFAAKVLSKINDEDEF
jgi:hypothetical protein